MRILLYKIIQTGPKSGKGIGYSEDTKKFTDELALEYIEVTHENYKTIIEIIQLEDEVIIEIQSSRKDTIERIKDRFAN